MSLNPLECSKKMVVLPVQPLDNPDPPAAVILPLLKANPFPCSVSSLGHPGFFEGLDFSPCGKRTMSTRSLERATGKRRTSAGSRQRLGTHPTTKPYITILQDVPWRLMAVLLLLYTLTHSQYYIKGLQQQYYIGVRANVICSIFKELRMFKVI